MTNNIRTFISAIPALCRFFLLAALLTNGQKSIAQKTVWINLHPGVARWQA